MAVTVIGSNAFPQLRRRRRRRRDSGDRGFDALSIALEEIFRRQETRDILSFQQENTLAALEAQARLIADPQRKEQTRQFNLLLEEQKKGSAQGRELTALQLETLKRQTQQERVKLELANPAALDVTAPATAALEETERARQFSLGQAKAMSTNIRAETSLMKALAELEQGDITGDAFLSQLGTFTKPLLGNLKSDDLAISSAARESLSRIDSTLRLGTETTPPIEEVGPFRKLGLFGAIANMFEPGRRPQLKEQLSEINVALSGEGGFGIPPDPAFARSQAEVEFQDAQAARAATEVGRIFPSPNNPAIITDPSDGTPTVTELHTPLNDQAPPSLADLANSIDLLRPESGRLPTRAQPRNVIPLGPDNIPEPIFTTPPPGESLGLGPNDIGQALALRQLQQLGLIG